MARIESNLASIDNNRDISTLVRRNTEDAVEQANESILHTGTCTVLVQVLQYLYFGRQTNYELVLEYLTLMGTAALPQQPYMTFFKLDLP